MSLEATLLAWSALAAIAVVSPGPDVLLVAGHSARGGLRAGLMATAGITMGGLWYMALCGFGFLSVLTASPALFMAVKIAGAAYLAYLGFGLLKGAIRPQPAGSAATLLANPFTQGLMTNALNPKVAVFYLAALPQFTGHGPDAPMIGVLLVGIHYAIGALFLGTLAVMGSTAGGMARNSHVWRWVEATLGVAFVGLAGKLAFERN